MRRRHDSSRFHPRKLGCIAWAGHDDEVVPCSPLLSLVPRPGGALAPLAAHPSSDQKAMKPDDLLEAHYSCLERLEDDLRHADLGIEERGELEDRVLRLRRRISS
jgi:hypothetical protein